MTESKFTKGPWHRRSDQIVSEVDGTPGPSSAPNSVFKADLKLICTMPSAMNWPDSVANGDLILVAPELYDFAVEVARTSSSSRLQRLARAVVAKAEGRS